MKKILFIGNISGKKMTGSFSGAAIQAAHSLGFDFHSVANRDKTTKEQMLLDQKQFGITMHHADISRSPLSRKNIKAFKQIVKIIKENDIDYIHCNTPTGGILGRLAGKKCKVKKVIYQVHGFHFYKGAPKKNWRVYYPVEKWLARYTDALVTINQEDYAFASDNLKFRNDGKVYYVHGVGINTALYKPEKETRSVKRSELGLSEDDFVLISAGELNTNKNNRVIISALEQLKRNDIHYVLCGVGESEAELKKQVEKAGLQDNVHFLGYRTDVKELYQMADCFVMPSIREGLSRSIMEAMSSGLPCIVSKIRGNVDLIDDGNGGYLCDTHDVSAYAEKLDILASDPELKKKMGEYNLVAVQNFSTETVKKEIQEIYAAEFKE